MAPRRAYKKGTVALKEAASAADLGTSPIAFEHGFAKVNEALAVAGDPSISTLYRWIHNGIFPRPVQLGPHRVGWRRSDLARWAASRETSTTFAPKPQAGEHEPSRAA